MESELPSSVSSLRSSSSSSSLGSPTSSRKNDLLTSWIRLKTGRFSLFWRNFWFEMDEVTEYVTYFKKKNESSSLTNKVMGTFCLEGAEFSGEDRVNWSKKEDYVISILSKAQNKYLLKFENQQQRDQWLEAFQRARERSQLDKKYLLENWNTEEASCLRCITDDSSLQPLPEEEKEEESGNDEQNEETASGDLSELLEIVLQDVTGKQVKFSSLLQRQPTVFILLRHFGCMLCRLAIGRLKAIQDQLEKMGIAIVAVGNGTPETAALFAQEQGFKGQLLVDQPRALYKALCCNRGLRYCVNKQVLVMAKAANKEGIKQGPTQGDMLQLGGVFIINSQGLLFKHVERFAGNLVDNDVILKTCEKWFVDVQIDDILNVETWKSAFASFLEAEFSSENWEFFNAVKNFSENDKLTQQEREQLFQEIYNEHISDKATKQINLPAPIKQYLTEVNQNPATLSKDTFKKAFEHIYQVLREDSLPRFRKSDIFRVTRVSANYGTLKIKSTDPKNVSKK